MRTATLDLDLHPQTCTVRIFPACKGQKSMLCSRCLPAEVGLLREGAVSEWVMQP